MALKAINPRTLILNNTKKITTTNWDFLGPHRQDQATRHQEKPPPDVLLKNSHKSDATVEPYELMTQTKI